MPGIFHKVMWLLKKQQIKSQTLLHQKNTYHLSKGKVLNAALHGFTADEYAVYNLDRNAWKDYIPEYERLVFREHMAEQRILLDNKLVFYHLIKSFAPVNTLYAYQKDGRYISLEQGWNKELILDNLTKCVTLVRKKLNAGGGEGFILLEYRDNSFYCNREECTEEDILCLLNQDDYLLEEYCEQSIFENNIWRYSVNTIRVITIMESGQSAKAVTAIHRFGMNQNSCVDNASAGGLYARIDLKTGRMSAAVSRNEAYIFDENRAIKNYRCHPVSGTAIQDSVIPNWGGIVQETEARHEKLAFTGIGLIAWDIALTEKGYKVIEANTSCTMKFMQTFEGVRQSPVGMWMSRFR